MHPDDYVRQPKCRMCGKGLLIIDRYRIKVENKTPCKCWGYSFPHARGRGFCEHNHNLSPIAQQHGYTGRTMTAAEA